jgi:hypothetical protein
MNQSPARSAGFDPASISRGAWVSIGGAVVLLISVFLNWYTASVSISGGSGPFGNLSRSGSASGVDATDVAWIVFFLALIALAAWVIELWVEGVTIPYPAWLVTGVCGALSVLLVLFRIIDKPAGAGTNTSGSLTFGSSKLTWSIGTSFGIWLALLASIAMVVGAYLMLNEQNTAATEDAEVASAPPAPAPPPPAETLPPPPPPAETTLPPAPTADALPPAAEPDAPPAEGTSSD